PICVPVDDVALARVAERVTAVDPAVGVDEPGRVLFGDLLGDTTGGLLRPLTPSFVERHPTDDRSPVLLLLHEFVEFGLEPDCGLGRWPLAGTHGGHVLPHQ